MLQLLLCALLQSPAESQAASAPALAREDLAAAARVAGLAFDSAQIELALRGAGESLASFAALRRRELPNSLPPALGFLSPEMATRRAAAAGQAPLAWCWPAPARPSDLAALHYASIPELAALVKTRAVSSLELAELALARLTALDPQLACVVTLTAERARSSARARDEELARGQWRGPLHGLPYGAKDLLAAAGAPTTFGSALFEQQQFDTDAEVIQQLERAGAVLVAKLSLGELAMGDRWFRGTTKNPWKLAQGSSGSSAGSAAAVAAGCVPFAIGSETLGSIVSPSARCGCSSLRPSFAAVDTTGAMALSWSMDKLGPLCRSLEDAAIVYAAIRAGAGDRGAAAGQREPLAAASLRGRRIGYTPADFEQQAEVRHVLDELRAAGAELVPLELPDYPVWDMMLILTAEAAASFDELTRDGRDARMLDQSAEGWPNLFRVARLIPAVEYLRANRLRTLLCRDMERALAPVDAYVHPSLGGTALGIANLTGHPCAVAPCGFRADGTPLSISFEGQLYGDLALLALAREWQRGTHYHEKHPLP